MPDEKKFNLRVFLQQQWLEVHKLFDDHRYDFQELRPNTYIALRNAVCQFLDNAFKRAYLETNDIPSYPFKEKTFNESFPKDWGNICEICGETRSLNICHIIPGSIGGTKTKDNTFILCPTHHHLFDRRRLSKEEFSKLSARGKSMDAISYFENYISQQHQRTWDNKPGKYIINPKFLERE